MQDSGQRRHIWTQDDFYAFFSTPGWLTKSLGTKSGADSFLLFVRNGAKINVWKGCSLIPADRLSGPLWAFSSCKARTFCNIVKPLMYMLLQMTIRDRTACNRSWGGSEGQSMNAKCLTDMHGHLSVLMLVPFFFSRLKHNCRSFDFKENSPSVKDFPNAAVSSTVFK